MGISFKVSKTGKRVHPKPLPPDAASFPVKDEESNDAVIASSKKTSGTISLSTRKLVGQTSENKSVVEISDNEVSFTLSLFPDGYSIAKPNENEPGRQTSVEIPKFLHPYDRASETLFSAIESGRLPGEILDDIPCKYMDGTLVCEVRDYRKCSWEGQNVASVDSSPVINRICLRMSLENIVKDIPAISDSGWTYGDLMEVESRILKALQPQLCLDPTPQLDKLTNNPVSTKLNLDLRSMRRKKMRQAQEVAVLSNNINGKKVYLERVPESSRMGDLGSLVQQQQPSYENLNTQNNVSSTMLPLRNNSFSSDASLMASHQSKYQIGIGSPRIMKDQRSGSLLNVSVASPGGQDMMIPFSDDVTAASIHGKRENQDSQSSPLTNKKARLTQTGGDGGIQNMGPQMDSLHGSELHWKNTLLQHQQSTGRGIQYGNNNNNGMQKFPQQVFDGGLNQEMGLNNQMPFTIGQQGVRYNLKEEPVEADRLMGVESSELTNIDPRLQQRMPHHQFARSGFPQTTWNNLGQPLDSGTNNNNNNTSQKRKLVQSPRVSSAGGLPQSPLSSKSGELSSGSIGHQFGAVANSGFVTSQKEKNAVTSVPSVSVNDSMQQRQNQVQAAAKRRSNSLPKTPALSGVASPASVGNMNIPINANSPPVGNQPLGDQTVLDRFSKIEIVAMRCQLNCKKNKVDEYPIRKANSYSTQQLASHLSTDLNNENLKDEACKMPLSTSMIGGNMNVCKVRILNFIQTERVIQGNNIQLVPKGRTRMIMSEKPNDGTVEFYIGEIEDAEYLAAENYLPTLPNTNIADLLAAQFTSLMVREGHPLEGDHLQPKQVRTNATSAAQLNFPSTSEMQHQFQEGVSVPLPNDMTKPNNNNNNNNNGNAPVNNQGPRMLPQAIQMSQGLLAGVSMPTRSQQQTEQMPPQHPQFQRSPMMLSANSMQHPNNMAQNANMQLGPHMTNKPSPLQLQILQQQHQQQQRKMMPGLGNVGMGGNIGNSNNMVGLGGLGSVLGIGGGGGGGGGRGVGGGGVGISAPMGSTISSSMNQSAMNLSAASNINSVIRNGNLTPAQAAYMMKMRMGQNRSNVLGSNPQSSGIGAARQMLPGPSVPSMLGRPNMGQMQRTANMGQMGPPKLMQGMNIYMNQPQQIQQIQQLQQLQQMQQQQQQQQQQQENVLSPPQVSSPIPHQMNQQHQQQLQQQQASPQQRAPPMSPQLSSGGVHSMGGGGAANQEANCPASPQLSSQTMGSVGSITNSPMELQQQGVSKSNSVNNP